MDSVIRQVGQGLLRPNYEGLPINVHHTKLLDWLVDRKMTPGDWFRRCVAIGDKVAELQEGLSGIDGLGGFAPPTKLNYFDCVSIVGKLKELDGGQTNMFGQYTSERLKQWIVVTRAYEKDGAFFGEVANQLHQTIQYDIPAGKRQIAAWQQQIKELARKDSDAASSIIAYKAKFAQQCSELKISGMNIRAELLALTLDIPQLCEQISAALSSEELGQILAFYNAFMEFVGAAPALREKPALGYVRAHGNATIPVYERDTGTVLKKSSAKMDPVQAPIDTPVATSIDAIEIKWDVEPATDEPAEDEPTISWDVEDAVAPAATTDDEPEITIELAGTAGGIVHEGDASILENEHFRGLLVDDLSELRAFVQQRLVEQSSSKADNFASAQLQTAAASEHLFQSVGSLKSLLGLLDKLVDSLKNSRVFMIKSSTRYVDRLVNSLEHLLRLSESARVSQAASDAKRALLLTHVDETNTRLTSLAKESLLLRSKIEHALSKASFDRKVTILGEVPPA